MSLLQRDIFYSAVYNLHELIPSWNCNIVNRPFASVTRLFLVEYDTVDVFAKREEAGMHYHEELKCLAVIDIVEKFSVAGRRDIKREGQVQVIAIHPSPGTYLVPKLCAAERKTRSRAGNCYASERTTVNESWRANRDTRLIRIAALRGRIVRFRRA